MFTKRTFKIKRREILPVLFALVCIALPVICLAQGPVDPEDTPIDGGLGLLLAAGATYGIRKYRNYTTANKKEVKQI